MIFSEIIIAVFLGIIFLVICIYYTQSLYTSYHKNIELNNEGYVIENDEHKYKKIITNFLVIIYFGVSIFIFATNITYKTSPLFGDQYYVSVNSESMAAPLSTNTYLYTNNLKNQIAEYDVAVFDKLEDKEIKLYDILLFRRDDKLIVHRVVEIIDESHFYVQGDNNPKRDEQIVARNDVLGIYNKKLGLMSFVNYLGYTPGFYVAIVGMTYLTAISIYYEHKNNQLKSINIKEDI